MFKLPKKESILYRFILTPIVGDIDLELLKRSRKSGTVTLLKNRRLDLYELVERKLKS